MRCLECDSVPGPNHRADYCPVCGSDELTFDAVRVLDPEPVADDPEPLRLRRATPAEPTAPTTATTAGSATSPVDLTPHAKRLLAWAALLTLLVLTWSYAALLATLTDYT